MRSMLLVAGFAIVVLALPAAAAEPRLQALSILPNPMRKGETAIVRVEVTGGKCGVLVDFGLGQTPEGPFVVRSGHREFSKPYTIAGSYAVSVVGARKNDHPGCRGSVAPVTLVVAQRTLLPEGQGKAPGRPAAEQDTSSKTLAPKKEAGPAATQLAPVAPAPPKGKPGGQTPGAHAPGTGPEAASVQGRMDSGFDCDDHFGVDSVEATPPLDPGDSVRVWGCGFGLNPPGGELRLVGDFPGGYVALELSDWRTGHIHGRVPMLTGVGDMPSAKLQVRRHDGKISSFIDVGGFRATREARVVSPQAIGARCDKIKPSDACDLASNPPSGQEDFFDGASFGAVHSLTETDADCDSALSLLGKVEERTDKAIVQLANGWKISNYQWWWGRLVGDGTVSTPTGVAIGESSATVEIPFRLSANDCGDGSATSRVRYKLLIWAEGPKGVPHH